jgi:hypothetical protein
MRADCENVVCSSPGALLTCIQGRCAPATVQDPSACQGAGCGENTLLDASLPAEDSSALPVDASTTDGAEAGKPPLLDGRAPVTDGSALNDAVADVRTPMDAAATETGLAEGGSCKPDQASCASYTECCSAACSLAGKCCELGMAPCMTNADCCSARAGVCQGGFCACVPTGGQCINSVDCCSRNCQQGNSCG